MSFFQDILAQLIKVEKNMQRYYELCADRYRLDSAFFDGLAEEEAKHAAALESITVFPELDQRNAIFAFKRTAVDLVATNHRIEQDLLRLESSEVDVEEALESARVFEESAGELHYQYAVSLDIENQVFDKIKELTGNDKDHADRIRRYRERRRKTR